MRVRCVHVANCMGAVGEAMGPRGPESGYYILRQITVSCRTLDAPFPVIERSSPAASSADAAGCKIFCNNFLVADPNGEGGSPAFGEVPRH